MSRRRIPDEWHAVLQEHGEDDVDLRGLAKLLDEYTVEYPPSATIQQAVDVSLSQVRPSMPVSTRWMRVYLRWFQAIAIQTGYIGRLFWLCSLLLYFCGYLATVHDALNAYRAVLLLAPLPFSLGLLDLLRSVDSGMAEMELACKLSLPQMVTFRCALIGLYNVLLNGVLTVALTWDNSLALGKVVLLWLVPFTWVSGSLLLLATKLRGPILTPAGFLAWGATASMALWTPRTFAHLMLLGNAVWMVLAILGLGVLALGIQSLYSRLKGGAWIETPA